jgi:hypothetical protein
MICTPDAVPRRTILEALTKQSRRAEIHNLRERVSEGGMRLLQNQGGACVNLANDRRDNNSSYAVACAKGCNAR